NAAAGPIKLGIATDLTGPLGVAGNPEANTAKMVVQDINAAGGLIGRPIELHIEDTASNEATGVTNTRKLIQRDHVDIVIGGITSSMRNAIKDVIIGRGKTLYIYPVLYEGKECTPHLFCTGPTPAQQCDEFIPWLIKNGGKRFALPGSNYIWPHTLAAYAHKVIEAHGGEVVFEEYYPLDQVDFGATVNQIMSNKADVVFNMTIPPGVGPLFKQLYQAGFSRNGGRLACVFSDESALAMNQPREIEGIASSSSGKWRRRKRSRWSAKRSRRRSTTRRSPGDRAGRPRWFRESGTARCGCTPPSRRTAFSRWSRGATAWSIRRSAEIVWRSRQRWGKTWLRAGCITRPSSKCPTRYASGGFRRSN